MARTQRRVELRRNRRKKRLEGSGGCAREPLHVELLRSAVVVDVDGQRSQGKKGRHLSIDEYVGGEGGAVEKRKISASLPSSVADREPDSNAFFASSDSETEAAVDVPHGAAADKKTALAAGGKRRALPEKGRGGEGLLVPAALSKKILRLAEHQQRAADFSDSEDERGDTAEDVFFESDEERSAAGRIPSLSEEHVDAEGYVILDQSADAAEEEEDEVYVQRILQQKAARTKGEEEGDTAAATPSLVDSILEKLKAKDAGQEHQDPLASRPSDPGFGEATASSSGGSSSTTSSGLPPKVIEVYTAMAPFLQKYRSGKLPKAFKVLPRLQQWEEILMLTQPQSWSPHTLAAATKVFCSNLSSNAVQRFLCLVLLPAVREDIAEHKKLNYHLYQALKKALFKPAAFFKGIFLPLALEGCSRKEAVIVGSVVAKVSIPVLHGAAALLRLSLVPPSDWLPAVSLLMNVLINKKYSLPTKAVQACVLHFHSFRSHAEKLPVSWHKAFLSFVQRYKLVLADNDRSKLHEVLRTHFHELIGPEIRRELLAKNPVAVLEQQALLLEKRQKQQQQEQQQRKTGAEVTAIATPMEVEV